MWTVGNAGTYNRIEDYVNKVVMNASITKEGNFVDDFTTHVDDNKETWNEEGVLTNGRWDHIHRSQVADNGYMDIEGEETIMSHKNHMHKLLEWHIRLGHMSMKLIQRLAKAGFIPKVLSRCQIPICAGCLHGKMTRQPWRRKGGDHVIASHVNQPGECMSVDQLYSSIPGLVGQIKGIPIRLRYGVATIFVDHYSDYTYAFIQTDDSSAQTLLAKKEFERHALNVGINIGKYHADKCRFIDNDD